MKTISALFGVCILFFSCSSNSEKKATESNENQAHIVKLNVQKMAENSEGTPQSIFLLDIDGKQTSIDTVAGEAALIDSAEYANLEIPKETLVAYKAWWAGAGDYFYLVKNGNSYSIFQGWEDEEQEDKGLHWQKIKQID